MQLLLDTHIWIWSLLEPSKLSRRVTHALTRKDNELWLSPISIWEALMLCEKKRIAVEGNSNTWIETALRTVPLKEAPLTHDVALRTQAVQLPHRDPADRFLIATALIHELTLVTADKGLISSKQCAILPNR